MPRTASRPTELDVQCALQFSHYVNAMSGLKEGFLRIRRDRAKASMKKKGATSAAIVKLRAIEYCLAVENGEEPPLTVSLQTK